MKLAPKIIALLSLLTATAVYAQEADTLQPIQDDKAPANFEEMWAGFEPRAEPLETETIKQWEQDGAVLRVVRFRIGVFKGTRSKLAAIYGYPKSMKAGSRLPGLLQIHGGGQYADQRAVIANAKRGYATLSIAWAGRISATDYKVNPDGVKLFWNNETENPKYKLTTDWGALDGYHAPSRFPQTSFTSIKPTEWTIDAIESPRNSSWFSCTLAARRALTFLEQQPEVDPEKLGVYGHSMGGKLTVLTASDERVRAAAPSCGGISDRQNAKSLFCDTVGDQPNLKQIKCPILFLSPANDFHGRIGDLPNSVQEIASQDWRVTCSPHLSHKDTAEHTVTQLLWFDQHLKGEFKCPTTPGFSIDLNAPGGQPEVSIKPDTSKTIRSVDVFFTQQGKPAETPADRENTTSRYWHYVKPAQANEGLWSAKIPLTSVDKPLWIYANVQYDLPEPVSGAGYYYEAYTANSFKLSSVMTIVAAKTLKDSELKPTKLPTPIIEDFQGDWVKDWYNSKPNDWRLSTHKVYDPTFSAPEGSALSLQVQSQNENSLLVMIDDYVAKVSLKGGDSVYTISLSPADFSNFEGEPLSSWSGIKVLKLGDTDRLKGKKRGQSKTVGKQWNGPPPSFRELRWTKDND